MHLRTLAVVGGLAVALLTAGCVASVAGQAEVDPAAIASGLASSGSLQGSGAQSSDDQGSGGPDAPQTRTSVTISSATTVVFTTPSTVTRTTRISDKSVPLIPTSIPGLSADCNKVIAGISAFSALLQGVNGAETISNATVETTLGRMPASGLPAAIQPDMTILRSLVSSAAGKTVTELALAMADGKAITALEDLSNWTAQHCI